MGHKLAFETDFFIFSRVDFARMQLFSTTRDLDSGMGKTYLEVGVTLNFSQVFSGRLVVNEKEIKVSVR